MSSPYDARAAVITSQTAGQSSMIPSVHSSCTSSSQRQRSRNLAPAARLSGVAWKSRFLLKGGSVAMRCTVSLFMPRRNARLSP